MRAIKLFLETIKFEHTIFALPFAYLGMVLAAKGWPTWHQFLWITVAMVAARTLAMAVNRVADLPYDRKNPRTAMRPVPRGDLSPRLVWAIALLSLLLFFLAAWQLNPFVLKLAPLAAFFLIAYSYTKRFTWLTHWWLGLTDGAAAAGAWAAVTGHLAHPTPWLLWVAVTFWIAGFDLIYACQDVEFDRAEGLKSIPARFGVPVALRLAKACHLITLAALLGVGLVEGLGWPYWAGLLVVGGLLAYEHSLVKPHDLSKVNVAFFTVNGYISVITFLATFAGLFLK
ncbi:MAG: UbiA family prenyltransferase [Chloroflexi bacterium]|nr:UbiA family prenyltransferase [Chloroflexota bacterium]